MKGSSKVGLVAIGRNEGERLHRCLRSVTNRVARVVYVDSGSADGSVEFAKTVDSDVIELDLKFPFTAARARNEGFEKMRLLMPSLCYVQFVDGDCEIVAGWIEVALEFLDTHPDVAVVCGRRRERHPTKSIFNELCDMEWDTPIGEAKACGGDALIRVDALTQVGGYRTNLIAGEEPELCIRLRAQRWRIWRLDADMTLHDAAMTKFSQWWRRSVRNGYAFAQGAYLHGKPPERHYVWPSRRAWFLGAVLPFLLLTSGLVLGGWAWAAWLLYPFHILQKILRKHGTLAKRATFAFFETLAHFPEAWGQMKFVLDNQLSRGSKLIEYK